MRTEIINAPFCCKYKDSWQWKPCYTDTAGGKKYLLKKSKLTLDSGLESANMIDSMFGSKANKNYNCRKQQLKFTEHLLNARNFSLHYFMLSSQQTFHLCKEDSVTFFFTNSWTNMQVFGVLVH